MEKLKFFSSLDKEQKDNAALVAKAAQEAGVDPTFAVAIAYKEGGLRTNAARGADGEIGMMQIMPTTGKGMGYVNKDLFDPQKNIEAGVKYLKKGLDSAGGDPRLAAIYYNGGPGAVEALKSGKDPDARVFTYIKSLNSYGTFNDYHGQEPAAPQKPVVENNDMVTQERTPEEIKAAEDAKNKPDTSNASPGERMLMGGAGAAAGAVSTGVSTIAQRANQNAARRAEMEESARIRAQREQGVIPPRGSAPVTPPVTQQTQANPPGALTRFLAPQGVKDSGYMAKGQTNVENYNKAKSLGLTDLEASRTLSQSKEPGGAYDLNARRVAGLNTINERFPNQFQESPTTGIMTPSGGGSSPRESFVYRQPTPGQPVEAQPLPPRQGIPPYMLEPKGPTGLDYVSGLFRSMLRPIAPAVTTIGSRMLPPAAGLLAGVSAADLSHEYDKPPEQRDPIKMGLKGASVLGGGLSMLGAPRVGVPLMAAGEGIQYLRENPKVITDTMDQISTNVVDPAKEFLLRQAEKLSPGANTQYSIYPPAP